MKTTIIIVGLSVVLMFGVGVQADTFGSGGNQFTIDFVPISGATNPTSGYGIVNYDYRMGVYEITNDQWNKFVVEHGKPNGNPTTAYDQDATWTGTNVPTNRVSWYEAVQFVNWLNVEAGKTAAYKFTGTQGTGDYTLGVWDESDAWGGTNLYRHKNAYYFLPTEDEWVKAAYWNETNLQTWATVGDVAPTQIGWNFSEHGNVADPYRPWAVGSGSEELNGTFDMMGNVWEWMESPYSGSYSSDSYRVIRGGSFDSHGSSLASSNRYYRDPIGEDAGLGFRVASIPEPTTLSLMALGLLSLRKRKS